MDGERLERARGIPFIDNDVVNLLSGMFASAVFLAMSAVL